MALTICYSAIRHRLSAMKGLILSGGKGTRLLPLTYRRAKQLIPVANEPVLFRVIRAIRDAGITDIGIVVGDTAAEIIEAVNGGDRFVMFLGDNVIQGGISPLIRQFADSNWNSQIVLKEVGDPKQFGVAELNGDGSIRRLVEKPKDPPSNLALVGIYMFDHHIREAVHAIRPSLRNELEITDAIQWLINQGHAVHPYIHTGWWIDTGKMADMLSANAHVLEEIIPRRDGQADAASKVDSRVTLEKGAIVENSVIRGPTIIGEHTLVRDSYIGPFTSIYHHCVIENSEIEHCIVLENSHVTHVPARIQDSILGRNVRLGRSALKPSALKMNLGDYSQVDIL